MRTEFYAPTHDGKRAVLQHADSYGERWLSIQIGTPVTYEDLIGAAPGCEPERVQGKVARVELRLLSPEPRLIVWLEPDPSERWGPSPMRAGRDELGREDADLCYGEFAMNVEMKHAACRRCGWLHSYVADGPTPPRPHRRVT